MRVQPKGGHLGVKKVKNRLAVTQPRRLELLWVCVGGVGVGKGGRASGGFGGLGGQWLGRCGGAVLLLLVLWVGRCERQTAGGSR